MAGWLTLETACRRAAARQPASGVPVGADASGIRVPRGETPD